jgi:hypothetical protein
MDYTRWTQTRAPFRVAQIENWNQVIYWGKLPVGTWYFYINLDHDVYNIQNSPSRGEYCKVTVT